MALLATSQITIVDLNDAVSLQSYLTGNVPKVQFVTNNGMYTPDYTNSPATITAELYRLGSSDNLITNNSRYVTKIEWFYKISPEVDWHKIESNDARFTLGGTSPKFHSVSINKNLMTTSNPGIAIKCEMTYKEDWMPEPHIQKSEMDFSLTVQGDDGTDAYTALLTNANHTIICSSDGVPETGELGQDGRAQSDVLVYKGSKLLTAVADTVTPKAGQFNYVIKSSEGCSAARKDNDTFYISNLTTKKRTVGANGANVIIEINCEGIQTLRQEMTITKVFHGADGIDGSSAKVLSISGPMAFSYADGANTPNVSQIALTATATNFTPADAEIVWTNAKTGAELGKGLTLNIVHTNTGFVNNMLEIKAHYSKDTKVFDTHTIIKVFDGKSTVSGYIWSPQGNIIKNGEMSSLPLEAVVFNGSANITSSATFRWVKVSSSEGEVDLPNNTKSTITISADDIPNLLVVKCYMTYSGTTIQDTIVLEDRIDPIQATVFSTAGDTFKNGTGETHLVARIMRNGEEIDSISVVQSKPSSGGVGEIIYLTTDNKYYKWSGSAWTVIDTPEAGANAHSKFKYTWYKYNEIGVQVSGWSRNGKVIRVQSSEITQKASFVVEVED